MKPYLILAAIIGIAMAILAWLQEDHVRTLEVEHERLLRRAASLGLSVEGLQATKSEGSLAATGDGAGAVDSGHRATAREFARELIAVAKLMKEWEKKGEPAPMEAQQQAMFAFQRLLELDPAVIPHLVDEIRNSDELGEEEKSQVVMISYMATAQNAPEAALNLFVNSTDLIDKAANAKDLVKMSLASWAGKDPEAALSWLERNESALPGEIASESRRNTIAAVFSKDLAMGLRLARELDKEDLDEMSSQLGNFIPKPAEQLELLRLLRKDAGTPSDGILREGTIRGLAHSLATRSFEEARDFLEEGDMSESEQTLLAERIGAETRSMKDPGAWLPWVQEHSPEEKAGDSVKSIVHHWTTTDFRAAAAWIGEQPTGTLRNTATHEFARTVAGHEPESAAEWALTLPPSEERIALLRHIHRNWQGRDEAEAAEFAAAHGLVE